MRLNTILNFVQPYKGFVYKNAKLSKSHGKWDFPEKRLVIKIEPRKNSRPICPKCESTSAGYDTLEERLFDYLPILGVLVYFAYARRRVNCRKCGVLAEKIPWATGKNQLTDTLSWYLASWAKLISWQEIAKKFKVSWDTVYKAVGNAVEWGLANRNLDDINTIGIDEIARAKGHKYLTMVYQIDKGRRRLLWIGEDRKKETLEQFFDWLGKDRCNKIVAVCSDMWKAYINVIKEKVPNALHILDRFHIVAHLNKAVDEVRAGEVRELKKNEREPILTKMKWILLRRRENLNDEQNNSLANLLKYNLKAMRAYLLKEDFQRLWMYKSKFWAKNFLNKWCTRAMRSKLEPMKKQAQMLRKHEELILNWFEAKGELSSGTVEGFNTKAKLVARKAYGYKSVKVQETALYHALGDLPVPEFTHRFT